MAAVAQIIAVAEQVKNGLGRHIIQLSVSQLQATERVSIFPRPLNNRN